MCFRRYDDADDDDADNDDANNDDAKDEPKIQLPRGDVTEGVVRVGSTGRRRTSRAARQWSPTSTTSSESALPALRGSWGGTVAAAMC